MSTQDELFSRVDALLARPDELPPPAERKRLRRAAKVTQDELAAVFEVRRETFAAWEAGRNEPKPAKRAAYIRLLAGWAAKYPDLAEDEAGAESEPGLVEGEAGPGVGKPAGPPPEPLAAAVPDAAAPATAPAPAPAAAAASVLAPPAPAAAVSAPVAPAGHAAAPVAPSTSHPPTRPAAPQLTPPAAKPAPRATKPIPQPTGQPLPRPARKPADADPRFPHGPLAVVDALDGEVTAYCAGGLVLDCPAKSVASLVAWALEDAGLGAPRLHRHGKDQDPLIVLTAAAAERFGLPAELADQRGWRLPDDHKVIKQLTRSRWKLTQRGFGPWARIYRPAQGGRRQCVQLSVLPWDALDSRAWPGAGGLTPDELAHVLGLYAARVLTPRGSTAVCGLELMTALRPATRPVKDETAGSYVSGPNPVALTRPVDPAPPEAPPEHPVAVGRAQEDFLDEEAYQWVRDVQLLSDQECLLPWAVGMDINTAFLAAAPRLTVGLGDPVHVSAPVFDKKTPGSWLVDLSHLDLDPRLPSPFTPTGERPTGPGWYATTTVAYAAELGADIRPLEAYLRHEKGPYLDPWHDRLKDAYLATMTDLSIPVAKDADPSEVLAAMDLHRALRNADGNDLTAIRTLYLHLATWADDDLRSVIRRHAQGAMVLSAIKATVKGGIGKLRERPQGRGYRDGQRWPALERPTWSPHIRAELIGKARTNMHRKMHKLAQLTGRYPLAVLSDCVVYPSAGPSPLDLLPRNDDGTPVFGTFRIGATPGLAKHEGTQQMMWAVDIMEQGYNPARHIKGDDHDAVAEGE
ncbi:telomere-associated protein Tap [Streptomyces piniterrae]|nr:XRE family transcriptional regulator [Streptomyces piniterrae]